MNLYSRRQRASADDRNPATKSSGPGRAERFLGFPLKGFGLFTSLLLAFAAAFFTFFATTCIAIFALLAWNCWATTR